MEIDNQNREERKRVNYAELKPIRGSIAILAVKYLLILFLLDGLYGITFYIFTLELSLPFDLHHHLSLLFFLLQIMKTFVQLGLFLNITLSWANYVYYFTDKHIIKRNGIFTVSEEIFQYSNIRSISIKQSFIGKLLNYGDVILKTSASGGYQGDILITGIDNPQKYEHVLEKYF